MHLAGLWAIIKDTANDWLRHDTSRLAAALAYYSLLSLAPLLVITIAIVGFFFGADAARGRIAGELSAIVGAQAAGGIQSITASAHSPSAGVFSTIVGVITLFVGASGVFGELQASLNKVWDVEAKPGRGILGEIRDRFLSFTMVLGVAFLLLVSLVISSLLSAMGARFETALPGGELVWQIVNFAFSLAVVSGLFALIFKYIPDAHVRFSDVWPGALLTAGLFSVGKLLLGLYLGKAAVGSAYGAAGSTIALVVWVYYAAQILLVGAELTRVWAGRRGHAIAAG
jgi:membrane protein